MLSLEMFLQAWWADFVSALPARLQTYFGLQRWDILRPGEVSKNTRPIAIALAAGDVLAIPLDLPLVSRWQLPGLMRFEALRHIPLPLDQVRIDFRIIDRNITISRIRVELVIARTETIISAIGEHDHIEGVYIAAGQTGWISRKFLHLDWRASWFNGRLRGLYLRVATPVILTMAVILAAQNWADRLLANRDEMVQTARMQAAGIEPLRQQLAANTTLAYLSAAKTNPSAAQLSEEIAQILPDDAWLQELDIETQNIRLSGTAGHATDLLKLFSSSRYFNNPQFESPLTPAPSGAGNQFDLTMVRH